MYLLLLTFYNFYFLFDLYNVLSDISLLIQSICSSFEFKHLFGVSTIMVHQVIVYFVLFPQNLFLIKKKRSKNLLTYLSYFSIKLKHIKFQNMHLLFFLGHIWYKLSDWYHFLFDLVQFLQLSRIILIFILNLESCNVSV